MVICPQEPLKMVKALDLSWWVLLRTALVIMRAYVSTRISELWNNCRYLGSNQPFFILYRSPSRVQSEFGYYGKETKRNPSGWVRVARIRLSYQAITEKLTNRCSYCAEDCQQQIVSFPCGCMAKYRLETLDKERHPDAIPCEECGKLHRPTEEGEKTQCSAHKEFFADWNGILDGHIDCVLPPEKSISSWDAKRIIIMMLKGEISRDRAKLELLCDIVLQDSFGSYSLANMSHNLDDDLRNTLATGVKVWWQAKGLLDENSQQLNERAKRHLRMVVWRHTGLVWFSRFSLVAAMVFVLYWHLPDWRSVIVLAGLYGARWLWMLIDEWR